jgi:hypothetical protein
MAQSDQTVQNATFPAVRADINDNLAALYSQSSGASAPTVTVAFQPWIDTSVSPPIWKIRNASDSGWITVGVLDANFEVSGITAIANGGTGQVTAADAINALIPSQTGNAGKFLGTNGTAVSWLPTISNVTVQVFTSSGTYTPTAAKTSYVVFAVGGGGGGGGGSAAGGGGSGGCGFRIYNNTELGSDAAVTVGGGGAAGTSGGFPIPVNNPGAAGGSSSFTPEGTGVILQGNGGSGGGGSPGAGGAGGATSNSVIAFNGNRGGVALQYNTFYSNGTVNTTTYQAANGAAASMWGAGQGGNGGAAGAAGVVVILEF